MHDPVKQPKLEMLMKFEVPRIGRIPLHHVEWTNVWGGLMPTSQTRFTIASTTSSAPRNIIGDSYTTHTTDCWLKMVIKG
jgi:hypothetical protein